MGGVIIQLSELTIRIIFLFIPGILSVLIIDTLTTHRKRQVFFFVVHSFLLGTLSYGILNFIVWVNNRLVICMGKTPTWKAVFIDSLLNGTELGEKINPVEIFLSTLLGVMIAIIITIVINKRYYFRLFKKLKITRKYGDGDIWDYLLGSDEVEWVSVRNKKDNVIYQGAIRAFSEKDDKRELYLSDVKIFDYLNGDELYSVDHMYIDLNSNEGLVVEVYKKGDEDNDKQGKSN